MRFVMIIVSRHEPVPGTAKYGWAVIAATFPNGHVRVLRHPHLEKGNIGNGFRGLVVGAVEPVPSRLDRDVVVHRPMPQSLDLRPERPAEVGESVGHGRRQGRIYRPVEQTIPFKTLEGEAQHPFRDAARFPTEFREATVPLAEQHDYENRPLVPDA